jgi:hypothetical protein
LHNYYRSDIGKVNLLVQRDLELPLRIAARSIIKKHLAVFFTPFQTTLSGGDCFPKVRGQCPGRALRCLSSTPQGVDMADGGSKPPQPMAPKQWSLATRVAKVVDGGSPSGAMSARGGPKGEKLVDDCI